jgi:hypothetical protein
VISAARVDFADSRELYRRLAELPSLICGYLLTDSRYLAEPVLSQPGCQGQTGSAKLALQLWPAAVLFA